MGRYPVLLDDTLRPVQALQPLTFSLTWDLRPLSGAVMTLAGEPPAPGKWVRITMPDGTGEIFRVQRVCRSTEGTSTVTLQHGLASLQDAMILQEERMTGTVPEVISALLSHQSAAMWSAGDLPEGISAGWQFSGENLLSALLRVTDTLEDGYRWRFDQHVLPWRFFLRTVSDACELRMRRNLSEAEITIDRTGMCTCLMPVGADGLTIAGVNGGSPLLISDNAAQYGRVERIYHDPQATDPAALKLSAQQELTRREAPQVQVKAEARDLFRLSGEELDLLCPGAMCRLPVKALDTVITGRIVRLRYPDLVGRPDCVQVTLANLPWTTARAVNGAEKVR